MKIILKWALRVIVLSLIVALIIIFLSQRVFATFDHKVYICHYDGRSDKFQTLYIDEHAADDHLKHHRSDYKGECIVPKPPVDCEWHYSECSVSCGGGIQSVVIDVPAENGGKKCPVGANLCNEQKCEEEPKDVCNNLEGIQEETPDGYTNIDNICVKNETKSKQRTFHKDTRCLDTTPAIPQWATREYVDGGVMATWSAMGGDTVEIQVNNANGDWVYEYGITQNDGHEFIGNVGSGQLYRIRVLNGCKTGDWLIDP
jgi:hypothetical protein